MDLLKANGEGIYRSCNFLVSEENVMLTKAATESGQKQFLVDSNDLQCPKKTKGWSVHESVMCESPWCLLVDKRNPASDLENPYSWGIHKRMSCKHFTDKIFICLDMYPFSQPHLLLQLWVVLCKEFYNELPS